MTATYNCIATTTLSSQQSDVTFSNIPGTYTDLVLVLNGTATAIQGLGFQFNGDTGNNYSATLLYGTGSSAISERNSNTSEGYSGRINTNQSVSISHIMNYSNTTTYKTAITRGNSNGDIIMANVCLWRSTSAITSIKTQGATFQSGCVFTLYGIKAE